MFTIFVYILIETCIAPLTNWLSPVFSYEHIVIWIKNITDVLYQKLEPKALYNLLKTILIIVR